MSEVNKNWLKTNCCCCCDCWLIHVTIEINPIKEKSVVQTLPTRQEFPIREDSVF